MRHGFLRMFHVRHVTQPYEGKFPLNHSHFQINWRPVAWGFFLQFILGLLVLRWTWGKDKFERAAHYIVVFLDYTNNGTEFVYGFLSAPPNICGMDPVFAFSVRTFVQTKALSPSKLSSTSAQS